MLQISDIDWAVLVIYFVVIAGVGLLASRRIRTTGNYFLGDRRFNKWIMIGQTFGTGTHAEMPVSLAGAVYSSGVSGRTSTSHNLSFTVSRRCAIECEPYPESSALLYLAKTKVGGVVASQW